MDRQREGEIERQKEGEIERQRAELSQLKERLALMCRQVSVFLNNNLDFYTDASVGY